MEFQKIKELINIIDTSSLVDFELKQDNFYVRMNKIGNGKVSSEAMKQEIKEVQKPQTEAVKSETIIPQEISEPITIIPEDKVELKEGNIVKAPMVGTFYASMSPDKPPIVKVGDKVKKGDLVCIIEAMKVMNEIKSEFDGEIAEILVQNEDMLEYGQALFRIV